jgi:excisionase family DNA binding protein
MSATQTRYLTVAEVAHEIDMTPGGVRKVIKRGELKAVKLSVRKTLVSRAALEAYRSKINGEPRVEFVMPEIGEPAEMRVRFEAATGRTPEAWLKAWKHEEIEDSAPNMGLMMQASALRAVELAEQEAESPREPAQALR